jgi:NTE family protein
MTKKQPYRLLFFGLNIISSHYDIWRGGICMRINGVFSGGGVKAIALVGALEEVNRRGYQFDKVAGTSAGSILAALIAAGYTVEEILEILKETNFHNLLDKSKSFLPFSPMRWINLYWKLGLYKGNALEKWLEMLLERKGIKTFSDLKEGKLKVIASDITKGRLIVLPDDLQKYGILPEKFSVAKAVRMSCSLPYFFEPMKLYSSRGEKCYIVDGGVLSNFPMWLFNEKNGEKHHTIGIRLSPSPENACGNNIDNAIDLFGALFDTMKDAHDARHIATSHEKHIIFIPVKDVVTTQFNINEEQVEKLMAHGRNRAKKFFKQWVY